MTKMCAVISFLITTTLFAQDHRFTGFVYLEGAYDSVGLMSFDLGTLIPMEQPFDVFPYNYAGTEVIQDENGVFFMTDWVLIEARQGTPNIGGERQTVTIETKAARLMGNGYLLDEFGNDGVVFENLVEGEEYYFCIRHRNHLDILSAEPILAEEDMFWDFSAGVEMALGNSQQKMDEINGWAMMIVGDYNQDGLIQITDFDAWVSNPAVSQTYMTTDGNLDGSVQTTDFDKWFPNKAKVGIAEISY